MNSRLLDLVTKTQDGYTLDNRISKEKFAELCAVLGKHGYRYAGKGVFKEVSDANVYQDPKWWKQNVQKGDWVKLTVDFFPIPVIREVLQIDDNKIIVPGQVGPDRTIVYERIREVLEVRRAAENVRGPMRKTPVRPRRP